MSATSPAAEVRLAERLASEVQRWPRLHPFAEHAERIVQKLIAKGALLSGNVPHMPDGSPPVTFALDHIIPEIVAEDRQHRASRRKPFEPVPDMLPAEGAKRRKEARRALADKLLLANKADT